MDDAQFMSEFGRNPDADMMDSVRGMAMSAGEWVTLNKWVQEGVGLCSLVVTASVRKHTLSEPWGCANSVAVQQCVVVCCMVCYCIPSSAVPQCCGVQCSAVVWYAMQCSTVHAVVWCGVVCCCVLSLFGIQHFRLSLWLDCGPRFSSAPLMQ